MTTTEILLVIGVWGIAIGVLGISQHLRNLTKLFTQGSGNFAMKIMHDMEKILNGRVNARLKKEWDFTDDDLEKK